jgi:nucleotide-binding universal stress UspA family protein
MTRLLVGTDTVETSEDLLAYLEATVGDGDAVYVLNSQVGGDDTSVEDVEAGEAAIEFIEDGLAGTGAEVTTHQLVRGNQPIEDMLAVAEDWEPDEYVIGIRKRSPVGKMVFGSTAQNVLLEADRTVRCVPMVSD